MNSLEITGGHVYLTLLAGGLSSSYLESLISVSATAMLDWTTELAHMGEI